MFLQKDQTNTDKAKHKNNLQWFNEWKCDMQIHSSCKVCVHSVILIRLLFRIYKKIIIVIFPRRRDYKELDEFYNEKNMKII